MQAQTVPSDTGRGGSGSLHRSRWVVLSVVVAAVVAAIGAWFLVSGDGTPTVTFDGETAVYDGPTRFDAGDVTFVFDASAYEPGVVFVFNATKDPTVTAAETEGLRTDPRGPWFGPGVIAPVVSVRGDTPDERIVERAIPLLPDTRYVLSAVTDPMDDNRVYFASFIDVD